MKTILFYELSKMLGIKKALICVSVVITLCIIIFFSRAIINYNLFSYLTEVKMILTQTAGTLTPEQYSDAEERYNEIINNNENYIETDGIRKMKSDMQYEVEVLERIRYQNKLIEISRDSSALQNQLNNADITRNRQILVQHYLDMFSSKKDLVFGYNLFYDFYDSFMRNFAPFILGFLIIFTISPLFSTEYSTKMDSLILSSKHGKRKVILSKFIAAWIGTTVIFVLVMGTYICLCGLVFGFSGGKTSLALMYYNTFQYMWSPYDLTMSQFFLISLLISYFACIGLAAFVLFISSKSRNSLIVYTWGLGIYFIPLFFYAVDNGREYFGGIIDFSYSRIMQVTPLFDKFQGYIIFGHVVMIKEILLVLLTFATIIFSILAFHSFKHRQAVN